MSETMKAVVLEKTGSSENMVLKTVSKPTATTGHVVVKVKACGVGYRDIIERRGGHPFMQCPIIQGHEFAGEVVSIGKGVKRWAVGDRVINLYTDSCGVCEHCLGGDERRCSNMREAYGLITDGGYAEYALVAERALESIPHDLPYEHAATLMSAIGVGFHNTLVTAQVSLGDTVLITGISGGVGSAALQTAKLLGAKVIGVTSNSEKVEALERLGADHVVVSGEGKFHQAVLDLTSNRGVDVVLDCVGTPTINSSLRSLCSYGRLVVIGNVDGQRASINLGLLAVKSLKIFGSDNVTRNSLRKAADLVAKGVIKPVIHKLMPLSEAKEAHSILESRSSIGRIVLHNN